MGGEHTMQNTDDVLDIWAPEAYTMLYNKCEPNKFN